MNCKHKLQECSRGTYEYRTDYANCEECGEEFHLHELINEVDRLQERADKAEAKLRRIKQVAIHTTQGNCIIPSSLVLEGES